MGLLVRQHQIRPGETPFVVRTVSEIRSAPCHPFQTTLWEEEYIARVKLEEFIVYLDNNQLFIVNYRDRYHHREAISSGFVESPINQVVEQCDPSIPRECVHRVAA